MMILTSAKEVIDAPADRVWEMLRDKIRNPHKYVPGVTAVEIVREIGPDSIERRMTITNGSGAKIVYEIISADPA